MEWGSRKVHLFGTLASGGLSLLSPDRFHFYFRDAVESVPTVKAMSFGRLQIIGVEPFHRPEQAACDQVQVAGVLDGLVIVSEGGAEHSCAAVVVGPGNQVFVVADLALQHFNNHHEPLGDLLRRTHIDEFPQLLNVALGQMSLVGPRPEMPFIVRNYRRFQHVRHVTPPGLTGLWQIMARSTIPLAHPAATAMDFEYLHRSSPSFDVALLFRNRLLEARTHPRWTPKTGHTWTPENRP